MSFSGSPSYNGVTRPDDYVGELSEPTRRMATFEEMRFSDDAVHAALSAREQMLSAANWMLSSGEGGGSSQEILEFVEDNLFPHLERILRLLAGALHYGFAAIEPVFEWADAPTKRSFIRGLVSRGTRENGRRIYLRKVAHPRQRTIYTFRTSELGDLEAVEQYVWTGFGFRRVSIPPEKLIIFTYNQQGDDRWGVPPTRHIYKAWTFKNQIERLNVLHIDRFGVGTPVAEAGPGWTDNDYQKMEEYLKTWRAGEENYLVHPSGGKISIVSDAGQMTINSLEWVKYYNLAIAKVFLTQGSELGSTETGARALGEVMLEQTETIVQADAEEIANLLNEQLVVPLVDMNFGPQDEYPRFLPSQRVRASSAIGGVIAQLIGAGAIKWEPKDEGWLRDALHLPSIDIAAREEERENMKALREQAARTAELLITDPNAPKPQLVPGQPVAPVPAETTPAERLSRIEHAQRAIQLSLTGVDEAMPAVVGTSTYRTREFTDWEVAVVKPWMLARDLDLETARLTAEVQQVLRDVDAELAGQVRSYASDGASALQGAVRRIAVPAKLRTKMRDVLTAAAQRARSYGARAVTMEVERQEAAVGAPPPRATPSVERPVDVNRTSVSGGQYFSDAEAERRDALLKAEVDRTVEEEIARRETAARSAMLLALATAGSATAAVLAEQAAQGAKSALEELSTARTADAVAGVVNSGFGVGRSDGADIVTESNPDRLAGKVYSAAMDGGTCEECERWDGGRFPIDYPEDHTGVQAPNPKCYGSFKRCRCIFVYVTAAEQRSAVPSSIGPIGA